MHITSFRKLAMTVGLALCTAIAGAAQALVIGSPSPLPVSATIENSITVTITTPVSFGTVGAIRSTLDTASLSLSASGLATEDYGTGVGGSDPAALVFDPSNPPATGTIDVTNAFVNTPLYVSYQNCVNPSSGGESFALTAIVDNLMTPSFYDCGAGLVVGNEITDGSGSLSFNVGATITTTTVSNAAYTDGLYSGSVEIVLTY